MAVAENSGLTYWNEHIPDPPQPVEIYDRTKVLRLKRPARNWIPQPPVAATPNGALQLKGVLVSPGIAKLSWNAVPGAVGYKIRRDGQTTDVGNKTEEYISNLTNGTSYFDVASYDTTGKTSEFSNVVPLSITGAANPVSASPTQYVTVPPDQDLIFGFPSTYVYVGGAIGAAALLYFMSGKK